LTLGLALAAALAGCRVHGDEKNVRVDTPFGGVHVNTDQTTAADLGLPVYPGAQVVKDNDQHKSADVHLGFGEWELRVKVVSYQTPDSQDKVSAFYKKALGRYGDVITCQGNSPVGSPGATAQGLTCAKDKDAHVQVDRGDYNISEDGLELKAGSAHHQHIVGFENSGAAGNTQFSLVALDLPAEATSSSGKRD